MSKETLQHTMRSKVRVFEDGGIRLLRKGQKGLIHAIFSRFGLVLVLLVLQFGALFSLMRWFSNLLPHYLGGTLLVTAVMMVYLLNQDMNNSVRIPWLVVTALAPVLGVLLFCYTKEDVGHRVLKKRLLELEGQTRSQLPQNKKTGKALDADCPGAASLAQYLRGRGGGFPVYENTQVTYFPSGEAKFAALLPQLESATQYIFLEYFIIDEGLMWGRILEILARKAAQGVDVRVMYDGTCEFSTLPRDYPRRLEALGIRCKVFAPVTPFVSTHYNYRDHRKILVVDGRVGFTGGVNLADEYINHVEKYGRWKDAAVMLEGEGVRTMTALFLQMWSIQREPEFAQFLTRPLPETQANGFVIPYGDCPLDGERVGEMVYIDLLNRARRSVHIITPYLILDGELETALRFAAERGVDVHLILPGKPDKWFAYALAKTHYLPLLSSGVKISEWVPGFTHAKVMIMDGQEAVVGTINLDYRSLFLHFECGVFMYKTKALMQLKEDCMDTFAASEEMTLEFCRGQKKRPGNAFKRSRGVLCLCFCACRHFLFFQGGGHRLQRVAHHMMIDLLVTVQHHLVLEICMDVLDLLLPHCVRVLLCAFPLQRPGKVVRILRRKGRTINVGHDRILGDIAHQTPCTDGQRLQQRKGKSLGVAGQNKQSAVAVKLLQRVAHHIVCHDDIGVILCLLLYCLAIFAVVQRADQHKLFPCLSLAVALHQIHRALFRRDASHI